MLLIQQFLSQYSTVLAIGIPILLFIVSTRFDDWARLAKYYKLTYRFVGQKWRFQDVPLVGNVNKNLVTLGVNCEGLYLASIFPVNLLRPALFIVWDEIEIEFQEFWSGPVYHLRTRQVPGTTIAITATLYQKMEAASGYRLPSQQVLGSTLSERQSLASSFSIRTALIAKLFAVTFAIGLSLGMMNHGVAKYQAWQQPDRYQIHLSQQYESPGFKNNWPKTFMEFMNLSDPIYVKVETQNAQLVSETYYSLFGSVTNATYSTGRLQRLGGDFLSSPLYMMNCVIPLVLGFVSMMMFVGFFGEREIQRQGCRSELRISQLLILSSHLLIMGLINITIYTIVAVIGTIGSI